LSLFKNKRKKVKKMKTKNYMPGKEFEQEGFSQTTEQELGAGGKSRFRWPPRHILVPIDKDEEGKRILPFVAALAKTHNSKVTLFTVGRPFQWSLATPSVPAPTTKALENRLISLIMELRIQDIDVDYDIIRGEKKKVMKDLVDDKDADLVILSNTYRHPWLRFLKGNDLVPVIDKLNVPMIVV